MNPMPQGDEWKNPLFVERWKRDRAISEKEWHAQALNKIFKGTLKDQARDATQWDGELLTARADRLEPEDAPRPVPTQDDHHVPAMLAHDGEWIIHPIAQRAAPGKLTKSKRMYLEHRLEKKAQREIACGLLGGIVPCKEQGHEFFVHYECGNRYCVRCGPKQARKLFKKKHDRLFFVAQSLLLCGVENCPECNQAITEKRLPHWPPPKGTRPRVVVAKIDFTLRHERGDKLPSADRMRELNHLIKRFCRAMERRFKVSRKDYGLAYCDELGGNNSNPHAHGIYVGPWLPQKQKELSALWYEITGDSFIISIKYAEDFTKALYHAVKYPAKFAQRSSPERLADLEKVFHRVRRFHTLARFYRPQAAPEDEKPPIKRCPLCDSPLGEPRGWHSIRDLMQMGLKDLDQVAERMKRKKAMGWTEKPPPPDPEPL